MPEQKDNSGALFKNDRKETDTHPDYKGSVKIAGIEYWISAWINVSQKDGSKYMSLKFNEKQARQTEQRPAQTYPQTRQSVATRQPAPANLDKPEFDPDEVPF